MSGSAPAGIRRAAERARNSAPRSAVLVVMCVGYFLVLLDVTIINVALPRIGSGLGAGVAGLQWVVDGYALALACLMLASGTAGDRYGHRRLVSLGLAVFGAGSLLCGLAPGVAVLVAGRVVQGVGAALMLPGTLAVISHAYPGRGEQARAIGIWAGIGSLALPAGPLLGGLLVDGLGWRSVFLVNVPLVVLALAAVWLLARESREPRARPPDLPGLATGSPALLAFTFAVIQAGHGGGAAATLAVVLALAAGLVLAALFVRVERRRGDDAMLPLRLFARPAFSLANLAAGAMNLGTLGTLFVLTLFLQSVQHRSPLGAGLALIPLFSPLAVLAPIAGRLAGRLGPRLPTVLGLVVGAAGIALLTIAGPGSPYPVLLPAFLLWGIGMGILTPAVVAAAVSEVEPERAGLASAVNNTARQTGGAMGIAAAGAISGAPGGPGFMSGFHAVAAAAAGLWLAVAAAALAVLPGPLLPGSLGSGSLASGSLGSGSPEAGRDDGHDRG